MSSVGESSPPRTSRLFRILSRPPRRSTASASTSNSVISDGSSEGRHSSRLRTSIEGALDRLKSHEIRLHHPDRDDAERRGIDRLLPKRMKSVKGRKEREREAEKRAREEEEQAARGRRVAERGTLENNAALSSESGDFDVDLSSLLTYDTDDGNNYPERPGLSTHPSHTGYLTTSSPSIRATVVTGEEAPVTQLDGGLGHSIHRPAIVPPVTTASLQAPREEVSKRPVSPVGKLKEALSPRRNTSPNTSPERKAGAVAPSRKEKDSANGTGRRGSVAARMSAIFPDKQQAQTNETPSPDRTKNTKTSYHIDTGARPITPETTDNAPLIVNTPPTPTDHSAPRFVSSPDAMRSSSSMVTSASGNMISHRRMRSGSGASGTIGPSKLSNITSAPLTPTPENGAYTPGTNPQTGFFSGVFSAAQNAANALSSSITNTNIVPGNRSRSGTQEAALQVAENDVEIESPQTSNNTETKELAVATLGMGDLSLSQLGITDGPSASNTPTTGRFDIQETRGRPESTSFEPLQRAVTAAPVMETERLELAPSINVDDSPATRSFSTYDQNGAGDQTPEKGSLFEGKLGRAGSIRSAMGSAARRKRGSSAATGTTIGASIAAGNGATGANTPKLTGFAVASKKRNRDFHQLFRSVPDDDYLIEDYSCALQREILAHGRLYVSEGHLCFSSNIFGWVTTLVMSFDEIVSVEKRSTALLFKNGLMISTLHAKNIFASFTSRDSTYDLIVGIWKLGHPSLRSSLNGVRIDETGGGDKTEKIDAQEQSDRSASDDETEEEEVYDEDEEDVDGMSFTQADGSMSGNEELEKSALRKPSTTAVVYSTSGDKSKEAATALPAENFPGPPAHPPTECSDGDTHYDKIIADEVIPAPLGKVYNLMFGLDSTAWMSKWLSDMKCTDIQADDKKGLTNENKVRTYSYIKPLYGPIGPKQTKCITTETLDFLDFDKAVSVTMSTQTPDVPSGNVFSTKTKYCLTWADNNSTRIQMNCAIEWTGKSWLKGPIEKGANDGQTQYAKDIVAALKSALTSRSRTGTGTGPSGKGKRRTKKGDVSKGPPQTLSPTTETKPEDWGLLEPLHGFIGPIIDIFKPLISPNMVYGLLVGLLVAAWFSFGYVRTPNGGDLAYFSTPERIAAYEEIWRREESDLWDWLETRVGMDRTHVIGHGSEIARNLEERLAEERAGEREVETAIRVTEEKLRALRNVVEKRKAAVGAAGGGGDVKVGSAHGGTRNVLGALVGDLKKRGKEKSRREGAVAMGEGQEDGV